MKRGVSKGLYYFLSGDVTKTAPGAWRPSTDIYETADHVVVKIEVPGVRPEDITVVQYNDRLIVRGVRRPQAAPDIKGYHQIEIVCGEFRKEIVLSDLLRGAEVEAALALGLLSIKISKQAPRREAAERRIPVETDRP